MKSKIEVQGLTKAYGKRKGIFDLDFTVQKGEVFGFLGPNGAGKTTTIRHLMGFIRSQKGSARIDGLDCFLDREKIQKNLGYLPGEIAFMDEMTGEAFLTFIAEMKEIKDLSRMRELMEYFELDAKGKIRKMSKGMKQKIGIVCAFMQNPEILILDEPTSGLDPLMQNRFIDLILEEKKKGTTVFLSSHIFEEIDRTCDRAAFIKEGRIIALEEMERMKQGRKRIYEVTFPDQKTLEEFVNAHPQWDVKENALAGDRTGTFEIETRTGLHPFLQELGQYQVRDLNVHTPSLEEMFLQFYGKEGR